ncbi:MAG TPA: hypothetical protein VFH83_14500 [Spirochaetia bacterium]|nr:hypothetical protein [Spirochaetia bacterium]
MHRSIRDLLFILVGLLVSAGLVWAARGDSTVRLNGDVAYLNTLGRRSATAQSLDRSMMTIFRATEARLQTLKGAGMGEGDVAAALATASRLPGGITDASIDRVLRSWRTGRTRGWPAIVKSLRVNADRVAVSVERVHPAPAGSVRTSAAHKRPVGSLLVQNGILTAP